MTIRGIAFDCDTAGCGAYCQISAYDAGYARQLAADRYGWSVTPDGRDHCGPCTRGAQDA